MTSAFCHFFFVIRQSPVRCLSTAVHRLSTRVHQMVVDSYIPDSIGLSITLNANFEESGKNFFGACSKIGVFKDHIGASLRRSDSAADVILTYLYYVCNRMLSLERRFS